MGGATPSPLFVFSAQIQRLKHQQKVAGRATADHPAAIEGLPRRPSRSSIPSGSAGRPCCTFFASPAKAAKQEEEVNSFEAAI